MLSDVPAICNNCYVLCTQDTPNTLKVRDSNVTGNSVQSNGGGFYAVNINLAQFTGVRFKENVAGTGELNSLNHIAEPITESRPQA